MFAMSEAERLPSTWAAICAASSLRPSRSNAAAKSLLLLNTAAPPSIAFSALGGGLFEMLAVDLSRAQQKLIDAVTAIVGARGEHISALEVDDFDDAVVLEADRAGELVASEPDQPIDEIDRADGSFETH